MTGRDEYLRVCEDDFRFFCKNEVWIRPKHKVPGGLITLEPNPGQEIIINKIDELEAEGKPVWIIDLKHRQWGSSTLFQAYAMHRCRFVPYLEALVIGDRERTTRKLMAMNRRMWEQFSPAVRDGWDRTIERTDSYYEWANGSILSIDTAGQAQAARGMTADFVHGSEVAFWPNGESIISSMTPALAESNSSMFIVESTSAGAVGIFWEIWEAAADEFSGWARVFIPWTTHPEYDDTSRIDPELRALGIRASQGDETSLADLKHLTAAELEWLINGDINIGQLYWRRRTIATRFMGREEEFTREFPRTADEAFRTSSFDFLNDQGKRLQDEAKDEDYVTYDIPIGGTILAEIDKHWDGDDPLVSMIESDDEDRFLPEPHEDGWIHVFEEPKEDERYIIGVDPSEGTGGDYAAFVVRTGNYVVACGYRNDLSTDVLAMYLDAIGRWYNGASLNIERMGGGMATINTLIRLNYPYLYGQEQFDEYGVAKGRRIGFTPTSESVKSLLAMHRHELNTGSFLLVHPRIIRECYWVTRVARRKNDESISYDWRCSGKGRVLKNGLQVSDDIFRAAALTVIPMRDSEWMRSLKEEETDLSKPAFTAKGPQEMEFHNPIFQEDDDEGVVSDGTYDMVEILPELDEDHDLPVP